MHLIRATIECRASHSFIHNSVRKHILHYIQSIVLLNNFALSYYSSDIKFKNVSRLYPFII